MFKCKNIRGNEDHMFLTTIRICIVYSEHIKSNDVYGISTLQDKL